MDLKLFYFHAASCILLRWGRQELQKFGNSCQMKVVSFSETVDTSPQFS